MSGIVRSLLFFCSSSKHDDWVDQDSRFNVAFLVLHFVSQERRDASFTPFTFLTFEIDCNRQIVFLFLYSFATIASNNCY